MYTPLYIKTDNSLQQSLIKIPDLIKFAKENNLTSLTITDNNMYGVVDFYKACVNNSIKPIIGLEVCIDDFIIVLYAMNYLGYKNLIKITTIMSYQKLSYEDISKYFDNLICIIPYEYINKYELFKSLSKNVYISYKNLDEYNNIKIPNKVYMNKTLYLNDKDNIYIKYLKAIKESVSINEIVDADNKILTYQEYNKLYPFDNNNKIITDMCNVIIPSRSDLIPKFDTGNLSSYEYLKLKCIEGIRYYFKDSVRKIYKDRLKYELDVINKMGFCDYFLIVADYVNYARENNIIVGTGRGSAVGSLVSYCLKITDVDPIKYNLLFERFLNPERISMPDIDIDFEHEKRMDVINYCIEKYGSKRVAPIITFGTYGAKQSLRDVASVMNIEISLIDDLCKLIDSKKSLMENYNENEKIKILLSRKKELKACYGISRHIEGLKKHKSIHAAGVIISSVDLDTVIPLDKNNNMYITGYDMTYLEELGLLKMDFLAIKYLTTIHKLIDDINLNYNTNITFSNIPLNDPKAINIFTSALTLGIFQFESDGMIDFLSKLKVDKMDDIFAAIALYRPGPIKNIPTYIARKNGLEKIEYIDKSLEPILRQTYGIMIYQEQIMQVAHVMANYTLGEADILRKAMSKKKKDILLGERKKFKERAHKLGYSEEIIDKVFNSMLKFAEYGFNKSHSVGYSIVAYKMAYLKAYYPALFIVHSLSSDSDLDKFKKYIYEAKRLGLELLLPDINKSLKKYTLEDNKIRYPLSNIRNIGTICADIILKERKNGKFIDIFDFIKRCYGKEINKKVIESLIYSNAFSNMGYNKKTLINNLDVIINYGILIKDLDREFVLKPEIKIYKEYAKKELLNQELDMFGVYITDNPIYQIKLQYKDIIDIKNIEMYFDKIVNIIAFVDKVRQVNTKDGSIMCFINLSDELSKIDGVLFPKVYEKYKDINAGDIIRLTGRIEKRFDKYQIVVSNIIKINY